MKTVHEVSSLSGISIRTLHHYDAIGLLKPTRVTEAGYRLYDDAALERLQLILLFRELRFSLKEIGTILDQPDFNRTEALRQQIQLLSLERQRLTDLIALARNIMTTGVNAMDFTPFDRTRIDEYAEQAKSRWGNTEAWQEYEHKTRNQSKAQLQNTGDELMKRFAFLGTLRHLPPEHAEVQSAVRAIQAFITENYYTCTDQIFLSLGQMYAAGGEMTENIDQAGGPGTAELARQAIEILCKK